MLVLFESSSGYAIFKVLDDAKVQEADNIASLFKSAENASNILKLKTFKKFDDVTEALAATTAAIEGKLSKPLKKILKKIDAHEKIAVADAKLGGVIKEKMNLSCLYSPAILEIMKGIRQHMTSLIGIPESDITAMTLGLAHSLSRYKLKFSPDKIDTMIVQAISLLDDLDKELNNYIMRCREWYGWHFPEMGKIVSDNLAYARLVKKMGFRTNAKTMDLSDVIDEEIEEQLKESAEISMGTEISDEDCLNIGFLCDQIIEMTEYRGQLYDYLKNRMSAIAPNLTILVGELVGARLIAHAGSLLNLAKHPASTVQLLGAEKALFRALKTRKDTPKYGLIYHASLVNASNPKSKGKISRMLAAKASLAIRYDALGEDTTNEMGIENRAIIEKRLKEIEEGGNRRVSGLGKFKAKNDKWTNKSEVKMYEDAKDFTIGQQKKRKFDDDDEVHVKQEKDESAATLIISDPSSLVSDSPAAKKIKKEKTEDSETPKSKKKKRNKSDADITLDESIVAEGSVKKEKKKKKKKDKTM